MLPIYDKKAEILSAVKECDTVIISAETGSGKSTQVPQYLREAGYRVICTEPRRIACTSLAMRVADEIGDDSAVGYKTAFESHNASADILYCTDGLQMAKGIKSADDTILIIDEVHEWNLNIETLVAWVKKFRSTGQRIKVILMSATIDAEDLASFYGEAICISAQGRLYDVSIVEENSYFGYSAYIDRIAKSVEAGKNVLAFAEGKAEINEIINHVKDKCKDSCVLIPLHGDLDISDQRLCFKKYDLPKVVVATNIAQTSITIPDIDIVVDNGMEKRIETVDGVEGLYTRAISKSDCLQRAGRAGRVKDGVYYLCSNISIDSRNEYSIPEIQRLILDKVVLKLISVGIDPRDIEFYHQPLRESINKSIDTLILHDAVVNKDNTLWITPIGRQMIVMPVSTRSARMIIEAVKYGCVDTMLKAVSVMEIGTIINYRAEKPYTGDSYTYRDFTRIDTSDILAEIDILNQIFSKKYPDLTKAGLSKKSFFRIKDIYDKLVGVISDIFEIDLNTEDKDVSYINFLKCLFAGNRDHLYETTYDRAMDADENQFTIDRNTCINRYRANFVVGFPRTITYKDRWGFMQTMNILSNISIIPNDSFKDVVGEENVVVDEQIDDASYDFNSDTFVYAIVTRYKDMIIDKQYKNIGKDDPKYQELMQANAGKMNSMRTILIGKTNYPITKSVWDDKYEVSGMSPEDILESDISTIQLPNGKMLNFRYNLKSNINLDIIRKNIQTNIQKIVDGEARERLPVIRTGSLNTVTTKMIPYCIDMVFVKCGVQITKYVGIVCDVDKAVCFFDVFDSADDAEKSTLDAIKEMIKIYIKQNYSDKKFSIKKKGRTIPIADRAYFHDMCELILEDVGKDNIDDSLALIDQTYEDSLTTGGK